MWSMSLMTRGDTRTLDKSDWKQMNGWIAHHEDFKFMLRLQNCPGKAFHCVEGKFYFKRSYA